mmetsp:Transcript_9122/g.16407  ORF Transcript_9122/g.16407 Transcript_9122/m.16407 type:complete len:404 (-) Transcript_9122:228-1439(-)
MDEERGPLRVADGVVYDSVSRHGSLLWTNDPVESQPSLILMRGKGIANGIAGYKSAWSILLIFVPLGIAAGMLEYSPVLVFTANFLGIVPLALVLGTATEDIAGYTNDTVGGLLNASFGNAVEMIISIQALRLGLVDLVKATLLGSVLSNLLLVLGCAFLFGGLVFQKQAISPEVVTSTTSLLSLSAFSFVIPSVFGMTNGRLLLQVDELSLCAAMGLILCYLCYLAYQLITHKNLFEGTEGEDEGDEEPNVSLPVACLILCVSCGLVSWTSEYLVDSVGGFASAMGLPASFVSVILLPIVGNAAEHFSAISVAMKDKMDLSVSIAVGSSIQIASFVAPFMVITSWVFGLPLLNLDFGAFSTTILMVTIFVVNVILRDLNSDWLKGAILLIGYAIVASSFFFY